MKPCTECGEVKPLSEYHHRRDSRRPDKGRFPIGRCKGCEGARIRKNQRGLRANASTPLERDRVRMGLPGAMDAACRRMARQAVREMRPPPPARTPWKPEVRACPGCDAHFTQESSRQAYCSQTCYWRVYQAKRREDHPLRTAARRAIQRAVERGVIDKPEHCMECGTPCEARDLHGHHHNGYSPEHHMDVAWVCVRCHVEAEGAWGAALAS